MNVIQLEHIYETISTKMSIVQELPLHAGNENNSTELDLHKYFYELRTNATYGSSNAREFTRNRIYYFLNEMSEISNDNIDDIVRQYHFNYFNNIYSSELINTNGTSIDREFHKYFQRYVVYSQSSFDQKLLKLAQIVYQELYGFSILDELVFDGELDEVACNRFNYIWVQYKGIKKRIPNNNFRFNDEKHYNRIIEDRIVATANVEMNAGEPIVCSVLQNGTRVTAIRPPLSKYYTVNLRRFQTNKGMKDKRKSFLTDRIEKIIRILVNKGRRNVAIIGEQGSGKTTAADDIVIKNLNDDISIGLAENIFEMGVSGKYPDKNVVELQYSREFKPSDITEIFFRLNRDIVVYGEVRSPQEAMEMIKAMLRQARGSMFTFHSSGVRRMIHDLRGLLMQTGVYSHYTEAQFDVADAIDIAIQLKLDRNTGQRYVYKVSEIIAIDHNMGFEINDLFVYEKQNDVYYVNPCGISEHMKLSCLEYEMNEHDIKEIEKLFCIEEESIGYSCMGK